MWLRADKLISLLRWLSVHKILFDLAALELSAF